MNIIISVSQGIVAVPRTTNGILIVFGEEGSDIKIEDVQLHDLGQVQWSLHIARLLNRLYIKPMMNIVIPVREFLVWINKWFTDTS